MEGRLGKYVCEKDRFNNTKIPVFKKTLKNITTATCTQVKIFMTDLGEIELINYNKDIE